MSKKEEKEQNEKPKKEKKVKEKKPKDATFLKVTLILCITAVVSAVISAGVMITLGQKDIVSSNQASKETSLDLYSKLVSTEAQLLGKNLDLVSGLILADSRLLELDSNAIDGIKKLADEKLEGKIDFKIFLFGQYELDKEAYPPVNFATQKQLLAAESAEATLPDFYKSPKGNYVSVAKAVKHPETKELLYTLLVSYPDTVITSKLPQKITDNTQINLIQEYQKGDSITIFSSGKSSQRKNKEVIKTAHPNWKLEYLSNNQETLFKNLLITTGMSLGASLAVLFIAIFFSIYLLKTSFTADASLILEFVRSANKKSIQPELFKTDLMAGLYKQLKGVEVKAAPRKKAVSNEKENLEIDIADGDENLFGSEEQAEPDQEQSASPAAPAKVEIDPVIFRAYDIRGIVDETLTAEGVKLIGQAIGSESISQGEQTVVIARDGRLSGPALSEALKQGILASGANVIDIGMVPTPLLYFASKTLNAKSGVMLTGSHNPKNHNGLKIVINGMTLSSEGIQKLKTRIEQNNLATGQGSASDEDIVDAYIEAVENDIILAQPMNVVIDCANGVAGVLAEKLFEQLGCNVTPIFTDVDGNFPNHHPDPGQPANLEALIAKVKETGADLGIAFDGDGDRLGIVTNEGKIIWPDRLMMLFSKDILTRSPGADIIFDVKCTNTLADVIRKQGGRPLMWKTGHSLIKAKLIESGAQLAGEMSGHIFFNDRWYGFDDALYSAARLLEILSTEGKAASVIFSEFPEMVSTPELNIPVDDEGKFDIVTVLASKGDFGDGNKTNIDGIRVDYAYGWGLIRASNTTANLVARFEAQSEEQLQQIQTVFKEQLKEILGDQEIPF